MVHPEVQHQTAGATGLKTEKGTAVDAPLTPVYPSTEGLQQISWRSLTDQALALLTAHPEALSDLVPAAIVQPLGLPTLHQAIQTVHRPPADTPVSDLVERSHPACLRLAFDEMLAHQLALRRLRRERRHLAAAALAGDGALRDRLLARLPFRLTDAQQRVVDEIDRDLAGNRPMMRLLQGDVGSGKTVVGALAALQAVECGRQVALMAPTELLAEQHRKSLSGWLVPLGIEVAWLCGRHKGAERTAVLTRWGSSSSTSSTASAYTSAWPCGRRAPATAICRTSSS
jgi:ATP-dependent DNA helicase RecG